MTNVDDYLLPEHLRPEWLQYPPALVEMVRSGRVKLVPWHLDKSAAAMNQHLRFKAHLARDLMPFAYRQDREDLACFEKGKGDSVMIIHDNTDPGWERRLLPELRRLAACGRRGGGVMGSPLG